MLTNTTGYLTSALTGTTFTGHSTLDLPLTGGTMTGALHLGSQTIDGSAVAFTGGTISGVPISGSTGAFTTLGSSGGLVDTSPSTSIGIQSSGGLLITGAPPGTNAGAVIEYNGAYNFPTTGGAFDPIVFNFAETVTGNSAVIGQHLDVNVTYSGTGTLSGELNGIHPLITTNAGVITTGSIENIETSSFNQGIASSWTSADLLQNNVGTLTSGFGVTIGLTNSVVSGSAASVGSWVSILNKAVSLVGGASAPGTDLFIQNLDPNGGIASLGSMELGSAGVTANTMFVVKNSNTLTYVAQFVTSSNKLGLYITDTNQAYFNGLLGIGTASSINGQIEFMNAAGSGNIILEPVLTALSGSQTLKLPDVSGNVVADSSAPTFTSTVTTAAPTTAGAGLILLPGTAPTSPVNGAIWTTSGGMYAQIAGATIGPFATSVATGLPTGATGSVQTNGGGGAFGSLSISGTGNVALTTNAVMTTPTITGLASVGITDTTVAGTVGISTTGSMVVGSGTQTGAILYVHGPDTSGTTYPLYVKSSTSNAFYVTDSGTAQLYGALTVGASGSVLGSVNFQNLTSGSIVLRAPTGALGSVNLFLPVPSGNDTLAGLGMTQTFSGTDTYSGTLNVSGTLEAGGVAGVASKTCIASAATLTITQGLITATSGC